MTEHLQTDTWDSPAAQALFKNADAELLPKLRESSAVVSLITACEPDTKIALELGACLLLGKPLVLVVAEEVELPEGLARAADRIVRGDITTPETKERLSEVITRMIMASTLERIEITDLSEALGEEE